MYQHIKQRALFRITERHKPYTISQVHQNLDQPPEQDSFQSSKIRMGSPATTLPSPKNNNNTLFNHSHSREDINESENGLLGHYSKCGSVHHTIKLKVFLMLNNQKNQKDKVQLQTGLELSPPTIMWLFIKYPHVLFKQVT